MQPGSANGVLTPSDVRDLAAYMREHRMIDDEFDIAVSGQTPGEEPAIAAAHTRRFAACGATWWLEIAGDTAQPWPSDRVRERIRQGPPRWEKGEHG